MCKVWVPLWMFIAIYSIPYVNSTAFAQQKPTESNDLQYIETVDLRELVNTVRELTKNVSELTKSVNNINTRMTGVETRMTGVETRMTGVETRMTVIEERTTWIRGLLYILLAAIVGAIVTPIILHILSNRGKQNSNIATVNELEKDKNGNQNEPPYDVVTEGELKTEGKIQ